jgi:hypothetical protein
MTISAGDCETGSLHPGTDGSGIKQLNTGKGTSAEEISNFINTFAAVILYWYFTCWAIHSPIKTVF